MITLKGDDMSGTGNTNVEKLPVVVEFLPGLDMDAGYAMFVSTDRVYHDGVTIGTLLEEAVGERAEPAQADMQALLQREHDQRKSDRVVVKAQAITLDTSLVSLLTRTATTQKGTVENLAQLEVDPETKQQFYHIRARHARSEQGGN